MTRVTLVLILIYFAGCKHKVELYCDEHEDCAQWGLDFCDFEGQYAESEGIGNTCIANPFDAGPATEALTVTWTGDGTVTSEPAGIACPPSCDAEFESGSVLTLTATGDAGSALDQWAGDCSGPDLRCTLTMDAPKSVEANFGLHGSNRWANHVSFAGQDFSGSEVVIDSHGNPIVGGGLDAGGASADIYVAKYDQGDGAVLWEKRLTTPGPELFGGIALDADGNVYVTFSIALSNEPYNIEGILVTPDVYGNIVVMRLDAGTGSVDWLAQWGGEAQDRPTALVVSGTNLFVAGETSSVDADFGGMQLAGSVGDAFLVKAAIDDGTVSGAKLLDGNLTVNDFAAGSGYIAIAGSFGVSMTIDTCNLYRGTGESAKGMVVELDPATFNCRWARVFGTSARASGLTAFPSGGWVVTGGFSGSVLFAESGSSLSSRGSTDVFVARYDDAGDHVWSFSYGGPEYDAGHDVAVTPEGSTILLGTFTSEITLGTFELDGQDDVFVTRMSSGETPGHEWAVALGGADFDRGDSVTVSADGLVYALAHFKGMTNVGGLGLTSQSMDAFLAALVR